MRISLLCVLLVLFDVHSDAVGAGSISHDRSRRRLQQIRDDEEIGCGATERRRLVVPGTVEARPRATARPTDARPLSRRPGVTASASGLTAAPCWLGSVVE